MKLTRLLLFLCAILLCNTTTVASSISFSKKTLESQALIYQLRLSEAESILLTEAKAHPDDVVVNYLQVVSSMLLYVTNESQAAFDSFDNRRDIAIDKLESNAPSNGYRDFLLEEIYFYSSVVNGKKGNTISAAKDVRNCYKYGSKVLEEYPSFHAAKKTMGLLKSGFGSLPSTYQKLVTFLGYESSMNEGIRLLESFIKSENTGSEWLLIKKEASFYLASVHLYLKNDKVTAWDMIQTTTADYSTNPLSAFARVNFADKCKKNNEIISVVQALPTGSQYGKIPFMSLMLGKAKLQRLDKDADKSLLQYLKDHKGSSYVKSCYQKLAWHAYIHGNIEKYNSYKKALVQNGNTELEEDDQAHTFGINPENPNRELLKTRLLFDGGYYSEALKIIRPLMANDFANDLTKTEYAYRKGRIYDALGYNSLAIAFYKESIKTGEQLEVYYASYSALYIGEIYEKLGDHENAKTYFKKATSFSNNREYRKSIEHRSKNGLKRIE